MCQLSIMHVTFCAEMGRGKAPPSGTSAVYSAPCPTLGALVGPVLCAVGSARFLYACHPRPVNGYTTALIGMVDRGTQGQPNQIFRARRHPRHYAIERYRTRGPRKPSMAQISFDRVSKLYGEEKALHEVSLTFVD